MVLLCACVVCHFVHVETHTTWPYCLTSVGRSHLRENVPSFHKGGPLPLANYMPFASRYECMG